MKLRDYQEVNVAEIRSYLRQRIRSVLWQLPTGGGKTAGATFMAHGAASRGMRVWFMVHRTELLRQSSEAFTEHGIPHGLIAAGFPMNLGPKVSIVAIGTAARRLAQLPKPGLIIWDECHHLAAGTWRKIYEAYPDAVHVGLSATPCRLDGAGLDDFFQSMVIGPSTAELIRRGYLKRYRLFGAPHQQDMSGIHMLGGDLNRKEMAERMDKPVVYGDAVEHYVAQAFGRNTLLFDINREMSEKQAQAFRDAGIAAAHIDSETDSITRARAIKDLERDELKIICNVDLFGEGVSVNRVSCIIGKRKTKSLALALQQAGRGFRLFPGQDDCILLDHAQNWTNELHGLPDDEREWSLQGLSKRKDVAPPNQTRECEKCHARFKVMLRACPECGTTVEFRGRVVEQVAGTMVEIDLDKARAAAAAKKPKSPEMQAQARARSRDELEDLFIRQSRDKCAAAGIVFTDDHRERAIRRAGYVLEARNAKRA